MIGREILHYRIEREIASGGMGVVYLATDINLGRPVALKFLPETLANNAEARERFLHEAKAASRLNHPNIITVYAEEHIDGQHLIVLEYVSGQTLAETICQGKLGILKAMEIATQLAAGLDAAHEAGIVHRDVSASNVLVSDDGWVKIVDFGLAALRNSMGAQAGDEFAGTLLYMSPEQFRGEPIDHRSDIWSFGILLYQMISGHHPFDEQTPEAQAYASTNEVHPDLKTLHPEVPGSIVEIIDRCLQKNPSGRYNATGDLVQQLRLELHQLQHDEIVRSQAARNASHSVAMLPLTDQSPTGEYGYFCTGVTEAIIDVLTQVDGLRVAPLSQTHTIMARHADVFDAGRTLGVETILSGNVRRLGERVHVSVVFNSVRDGVHLWTEEYDRPVDEIFVIQDRIVESVARSLKLLSEIHDNPRSTVGETSDSEAYDYYLRGRAYFHHGRQKSLNYARELFAHATEVDPGYVLAYVGIANCCSLLVHFYGDPDEATLHQADCASQTALDLDPASADAHAARGFLLWLMNRHGDADWEFDTAIRLNPRLSEAYYLHGRSCFQRGLLPESARLFETACRLEDRHDYLYFTAQTLTALGRADDARSFYQKTIDAAHHRLALNPDDAGAAAMAAVAHCRLDQPQEGLAWADRAVAIDSQDSRIIYNVACLHALEGHQEQAIDYLERAVHAGFAHRDWVEHDPDLDSIRDDPRFKNLQWRQQ